MFNIRYSLYIKALAIMLSFAFIFESSGYAFWYSPSKSNLRLPMVCGNRANEISRPQENNIESSAARLITEAFGSLCSGNDKDIKEAIELLFALQIKEACPAIRGLLDYPKVEVRIIAIGALGLLEDKEAFDKMTSCLFINGKTDDEVKALSQAILMIDYEMAWQFLFDNYNKLPHNSLRQVYAVFCENIRPQAIPLIRNFVKSAGGKNLLVLTLLPALGDSGLQEARELLKEPEFDYSDSKDEEWKCILLIAQANLGETWAINLVFKIFRENPLIFGRMLYRANRSIGYRLKLMPELQSEFIPILKSEFNLEFGKDIMDPALLQLALIEAALVLGRLGKKEVVPYLQRCIETTYIYKHKLEEDIISVLWDLKDQRSIPLFEGIAFKNINDEESLIKKGLLAIYFLIDIGAEDSLRRLLDFTRNNNINIREIVSRALYQIKAKRENVPMRDISEFTERLPDAVWVPGRIHAEDADRRAQIDELLREGVILSWEDGVKRYPWWAEWKERKDSGELFFTPIRDPSFILMREKRPYYAAYTKRSFIINNKTRSYVVKHCGADVPFAENYLSMPYHYEHGIWLYGGELSNPSERSREMDNALAIESVAESAFNSDPVLKIAKARFGAGEDVFLRPMARVEPLFMPVGLLENLTWNDEYIKSAGGQVAFLPISDGLRLAGVKDTEQQNLYMYIYKNDTGVDTRIATYFHDLSGKRFDWAEFFVKRGYKKVEEGGAIYVIKDASKYTIQEACSKTLQEMAARFGVFIRVAHDHLKRSCHRENGDIFTYQNTSEKVVFDYETFGLDGYTDANIKRQIMNAAYLINDTANSMGLGSEQKRQAISIFRSIITGEIAQDAQLQGNSPAATSL